MVKEEASEDQLRQTKDLLDLKRRKVKIAQLFLDPNNPRFGLDRSVPDRRVTELGVQDGCVLKIKDVGIGDLLATFKRYGFVPTDPVVVRKIGEEKYVVLEGNRRVAVMKILVDAHEKGDEHFDQAHLDSMTEFEVLIYEGKDPDIAWILQGLRHMSGIKNWEPAQQAAFVAKIEKQLVKTSKRGRPPGMPTVARTAGVTVPTANRLLRSYHAFEQAKADEEYGTSIDDKKFSMFAEAVFRDDQLQKWLGWNDDKRSFGDSGNLKKFLS